MVENGADINAKDDGGWTALMLASYNGEFEVVKYLVESGANINAKDNDGRTALMLASLNGKFEVVEYLIEKGANVNAENNDGLTASDFATRYFFDKISSVNKLFSADKNK